MKPHDLMKQCRYYYGQDSNPFRDANMAWFWDMERIYVENNGDFEGEKEYYNKIKGKRYSGIPFNLLMVMFTSWGK